MPKRALRWAICRVPMPVQRLLLGLGFRAMRLMYPALREGLGPVEGKRFLIELADCRRRYCLVVREGSLQAVASLPGQADVSLRGEFGTFLDVLEHRIDPDAALFRRKIRLVGEMGPAVYLKHLLTNLSR